LPPRVYCDFNDRLDRVTYGLRVRGTREDLARLGLQLVPGMAVTLYDADALEDGSPAWLVADAVVVTLPSGEYAAEVDPESFRWEARHGGSAPLG
jgi:hypothetical protein